MYNDLSDNCSVGSERANKMRRRDKLLERILRGTSDASIPFAGMCQLLHSLGFDERIRGSHHIFTKEGVDEILNLSPRVQRPNLIKSSRFVV
jgi:hypothetical protein